MSAAAESAFLEDRPIEFSIITSWASNPEFYQIGLNSPSVRFENTRLTATFLTVDSPGRRLIEPLGQIVQVERNEIDDALPHDPQPLFPFYLKPRAGIILTISHFKIAIQRAILKSQLSEKTADS
jgi:hypothetical protein